MIQVEPTGDNTYQVTVEKGGSSSQHTVTLPEAYFRKLSEGYARTPPGHGWDGVVSIDKK